MGFVRQVHDSDDKMIFKNKASRSQGRRREREARAKSKHEKRLTKRMPIRMHETRAVTINRECQLLLERRIKPMAPEEFIKQLDRIIVSFQRRYPESQQLRDAHIKEYPLGDIELNIPYPGGEIWRELTTELGRYISTVGWWDIAPPSVPDYYMSTSYKGDKNNLHVSKLGFAPNPHPASDAKIKPVPEILYHATEIKNVKSIEKRGILPSDAPHKKSYAEASDYQFVYVAKTPEAAKHILHRKGIMDSEIVVYRIFAHHLPRMSFYQDPAYVHGYYTPSHIPREFILPVSSEGT